MNRQPPRIVIRISAFLRKEIFVVVRQPLLVLTLVLGPFLILLFFGIGYRNEARALRTIVFVEGNQTLAEKIEEYASTLGQQLIFIGITDDIDSARESLRQGEIDLITVVPADAYETVQNNQQAILQLYHHEIDPLQTDYINVFGRVYVNEINRRILRFVTSAGQADISQAQERLETAQTSASALQGLLERCAQVLDEPGNEASCDSEAAQARLKDLDHQIDQVDIAVGDRLNINDTILQALNDTTGSESVEPPRSRLSDIVENTNELEQLGETADDYIAKLEILAQLEVDLANIKTRLDTFLDIDPRVLISPFRSEATSIATIVPGVAGFFAPSVVALLLQHLAITFAGLSMVRERQLGAMELFYVSPLSAFEALVGKYLSYLLFGGVLAIVLFLLVVFGLGTPMLGSWFSVAIITLGLLLTSLGIGFLISLVSDTDIQAVQYAMIVLLTSVFFSGFFLSLETLWEPVRVISWALPVTYAILLYRDVMLRGDPMQLLLLAWLFAFGSVLFVGAWLLLRRSMGHS
jgi:ABC-2 type transport system permease protein